jgi:hypothetical protein
VSLLSLQNKRISYFSAFLFVLPPDKSPLVIEHGLSQAELSAPHAGACVSETPACFASSLKACVLSIFLEKAELCRLGLWPGSRAVRGWPVIL